MDRALPNTLLSRGGAVAVVSSASQRKSHRASEVAALRYNPFASM